MIAVNDPIEYREIVDGRPLAVVLAYCTKVHSADCIDLGWRGDGNIHPDNYGRDGTVHRRTRVPALGVILVGDGISNTPQPRQHVQWERR